MAANTAYQYFWRIESLTNVPAIIIIGGVLELDRVRLPGSDALTSKLGTMTKIVEAFVEVITGDNEIILRLVYASNVPQPVDSYVI